MAKSDLWERTCSPSNLWLAWTKIKRNNGGAGVDGVTIADFEMDADLNLQIMQHQLRAGTYDPLPVLRWRLERRREKERYVNIPTLRDRIVQHSLLTTLYPVFDKEFLDCSFGYRRGLSALDAVARVDSLLRKGHVWVLRADIQDFFESVDQDMLLQLLKERHTDTRVMDLIQKILKAGTFENMTFSQQHRGITVGSVMSPLLANIYLHDFDVSMTREGFQLVRYADDFVILEDSFENVSTALEKAHDCLDSVCLELNKDKTKLVKAENGFAFLGYHFDTQGKGPDSKALKAIEEKLLSVSKAYESRSPLARIEALKQILRGWINYFRTCRGIEPREDCYVCIALVEVSLELGDTEWAAKLVERQHSLPLEPDGISQVFRGLALSYSSAGLFSKAKECYGKALDLQGEIEDERESSRNQPVSHRDGVSALALSDDEVGAFLGTLQGRKNAFAQEEVDESGRRRFVPVRRAMTVDDIKKHLNGEETLAIYPVTEQFLVHLAVVDIDVNYRVLLECHKGERNLAEFIHLAAQDVKKIANACCNLGLPFLVEDSGHKGYHLWLLFDSPVPAKLAKRLLKALCNAAGCPNDGIHWEIFPNRDELKGDDRGQLIKLPLGIHGLSGRRCLFVDDEGNALPDQGTAICQAGKITWSRLEDILLTLTPRPKDIGGQEPSVVKKVLSGCKVVNYLVEKAKTTCYLTHAERLTLLYTLGQLGEDGKRFLHRVISYCVNYDYEYTERQIRQMKSYPISCARVRDKHEDIATAVGCNCNLKTPPKGYPSPVLHALTTWANNEEGKKRNAADEREDCPNSNFNGKVKKYIELRKQLRGLHKSLCRIEEEMNQHLDKLGTDEVETDLGVLHRERRGEETFWCVGL
jgi:group II intron reverse transcriptase/maturase